MRIYVSGATGALGTRLVPLLRFQGHQVVGMTTSSAGAERLRAGGTEPVVADALDREAVRRSVIEAEPDVVVHQATALRGSLDFRNLDKAFALTNRLRIVGTDNLLAAAREAGARRFVAQSFAGWPFAKTGGPAKTEEAPLDDDPPAKARRTIEAIKHLEQAVTGAEGIEGLALRYGGFYGPGTSLTTGGEHVDAVRKRKFPIIGPGTGVWSFLHIDDAATATLAAIERGAPGLYNLADDEPAPVSEWLPYLADVLGAKPPRRVPVWLGRMLGGETGVVMFTKIRGASNAKAKRELGWTPQWPTWREGFRHGLDAEAAPAPASTPRGAR